MKLWLACVLFFSAVILLGLALPYVPIGAGPPLGLVSATTVGNAEQLGNRVVHTRDTVNAWGKLTQIEQMPEWSAFIPSSPQAVLASPPNHRATIVFVHGYNNTMEVAIGRGNGFLTLLQ